MYTFYYVDSIPFLLLASSLVHVDPSFTQSLTYWIVFGVELVKAMESVPVLEKMKHNINYS